MQMSARIKDLLFCVIVVEMPGHIAKNCRTGMPAIATNNLLRITAPNQNTEMLKIEGPSS